MRSQSKKIQTLVQLTKLQSMLMSKSLKTKIQLEKTNKKMKTSRLHFRKWRSIKQWKLTKDQLDCWSLHQHR